MDSRRRRRRSDEEQSSSQHQHRQRQSGGEDDEEKNKVKPSDGSSTRREDGAAATTHKPNFGLSGTLASDVRTGNVHQGVVRKHAPPADSAMCTKDQWILFVFKSTDVDTPSQTLYLHRKATYTFGRDASLSDIVLADPACSKEHAVIQYRRLKDGTVRPYLMDLESTNGTKLNDELIPPARYVELKDGDVFTIDEGVEYVLKKSAAQQAR